MSDPEPSQPQGQAQPPPTRTRTYSRNHLTIFLTGATLLTLSSLLTRRSLLLRRRSILPPFYHPSHARPLLEINGRLEAYQALGIATVNVAGFFVMMGGGLLWAFDVGGVEDLRRRGGKWRGKGTGKRREDEEEEGEEEELERWVASLAGRAMGEGKEKEERRWSARETDEATRAREERYAVVEPRATKEREKPG